MKLGGNATVKRGGQSWAYIYVALGFTLAIEGTIIQMIDPVSFPWNLIAYLGLGIFTGWLFLFHGGFQNRLLMLKSWYEDKSR